MKKEKFLTLLKYNPAVFILGIIAVALIICSFILPPLGFIDNSVLAASGEIIAWAILFIITYNQTATGYIFKKGDTEIHIDKNNEED